MKRDALPISQDTELLRLVLLELRNISAKLDHRAVRGTYGAGMGALLHAINGSTAATKAWTGRELVAHDDPHLHGAIVRAVGSAHTARRLGKALRRIEGQDFEGLTVRCCGQDRDGLIWHLQVLADTHTRD